MDRDELYQAIERAFDKSRGVIYRWGLVFVWNGMRAVHVYPPDFDTLECGIKCYTINKDSFDAFDESVDQWMMDHDD